MVAGNEMIIQSPRMMRTGVVFNLRIVIAANVGGLLLGWYLKDVAPGY